MLLVLSDAYRRQYGFDSCAPVMANLYGPDDNWDPEDSHVIAAMIGKYVKAVDEGLPAVTLWGTGSPSREFLYVDDAARALVLAAERYDSSDPVNIGTGTETRIKDLAEMMERLTGFKGETVWDTSRPDGQPVRYLDVSRARERFGFEAEIRLEDGLQRTIESYRTSAAQTASTSASVISG
jgi:GDP-L-fucose synthase